MQNEQRTNGLGRRQFVGASAAAVGALPALVLWRPAQAQQPANGAKAVEPPAKPLAELIADFIAGFDLKRVPPDVIDRARIAFTDTVGVMLAGSREEVARIAADMVQAEGSAPSCSIVGQSFRASPQLAALANGVAAHAMDYDFTFLTGQSVSPVIPAILPLAESLGATPADCVAAFIVGAEVAARIGRASPRLSNDGGWHSTGTIGAIAAAAASARLMKLPAEKTAQVLGIAVSLASGVAANYGTMTKPLHSGNAARNGVMAALLGSRGFTSHAAAFEAVAGFFHTFGRGLPLSYEPFKDFGQRWDLVSIGLSLKAYPCGGRGHTAIEAALALREKLGARLSDITNIHCSVSRSSAQRINTEWPATVEAAKFSAAYVIAYALVHGAPRIPAFTEEALRDARVRELAKIVTASGDPEFSDAVGESAAKLKVTLRDGQSFDERRDYATGSQRMPMTQAQLEGKFLDAAAQSLKPDAAKKVLAILNAIAGRPSLADLWPLIRTG